MSLGRAFRPAGAARTVRTVPDTGALLRSRRRIERMCESGSDATSLRVGVIDALRDVIDFHAYAWLLTDPASTVGVAPLADVPWLPELPRQIRLKYATRLNRWTGLGRIRAAALDEATSGDRSRSMLWRDLLVHYGIGDAASVVFEDRFGCWAFLELWRTDTAVRFTRSEIAFLADLTDPLTTALRMCQAATFVVRRNRDRGRVGPAVLVLSPDLRVRGQTPPTSDYLRVLLPPPRDGDPIPAAAYNVAAQLLAVEAGIDEHPPTARVHVAGGVWMTVRAARIDGSGPAVEHNIAVTLEESSAIERVDLLSRACGLTARERDLLDHLVTGHDTREVARLMLVSENTVQDHLKSIFTKTSVHSRRELLSHALGS